MPGRMGFDFGTSNSVVAVWDEQVKLGVPIEIPDLGLPYQYKDERISVVPSLIHYAADGSRGLGNQVISRGLLDDGLRTFRFMKRYIANRSPVKRVVDGNEISHAEAGRDFIMAVLAFASAQLKMGDEEIALSVPVESFEHYEDWLEEVARSAGMGRFRLIDEPSAAALGYGAHIQPNDVYLVCDFGGGTMNAAMVLIEEDKQGRSGRRCRVLGKAGAEMGGSTIDGWIYQEVLRLRGLSEADPGVRAISARLLSACEQAKMRLSIENATMIELTEPGRMVDSKPGGAPNPGMVSPFELTRAQFEDLLRGHGFFKQIHQTLDRCLNDARERGFGPDQVKAVLMVGGGSLIPAVGQLLDDRFGSAQGRIMLERPLDAVARGAAAFVAGIDFYDHIQHDYAVRHVDPRKGNYEYRTIVKRGTAYPTTEPVARITVKATHDDQARLGIAIFEIGEGHKRAGNPLELVFDPTGAPRLFPVSVEEEEKRTYFWMNENQPTFLAAAPPARRGEARFQVEFGIDANKQLLITTRDTATGKTIHRDYPVVKLT